MQYFFVIDGDTSKHTVKGYIKEEGKNYYRDIKKSEWKRMAKSGTFYEKSGYVKFTNVPLDKLANYLAARFDNCQLAVVGG